MDFVTLEELAAYLSPRAPRDLSGDVLAELAITAASERIQRETGQHLALVEADTVVFSGNGAAELILPELPVIAVDEVRIDGEVDLDWELLSNGLLRRSPASDFTNLRPAWAAGSTIEVEYAHGYEIDASASELPAELRLLTLTLAARAYQQGLARQESTGSSSVTWSVPGSLDLTSGERAILAKHRHPREPTIAATAESS